jgi:hypothetical protein
MNAVPLKTRRTPHAGRSWVAVAVLSLLAFLVGPVPASNASSHTGNSPFGNFDNAVAVPGGILVWGWVIDPDTVSATYAWVTIDGVGRHLLANQSRPDVAAVYPAFGPDHGFRGTLSASKGTHRVCVTGHNVGPGSPTSFGCRTVNVIAPGSPIGNFERAVGVVDGVDVKGWIIDPDRTGPTYAWVTVDGSGRHILANETRLDVGAAFPGYGPQHGFRSTIPATPGLHTVCVTGHNVGPGGHTNLGCMIVVVGSQECPPFGSTGVQGTPGGFSPVATIWGKTMRVAENACFDRFVFEFAGEGAGEEPDWAAIPTRTLLDSETGEPITPRVAGSWYILVIFGAWDTGEPLGEAPFAGPNQILTPGLAAIKEARRLGGFEAISEVVIGVDNPRPYRVTWLDSPRRLVVDVFTGIA